MMRLEARLFWDNISKHHLIKISMTVRRVSLVLGAMLGMALASFDCISLESGAENGQLDSICNAMSVGEYSKGLCTVDNAEFFPKNIKACDSEYSASCTLEPPASHLNRSSIEYKLASMGDQALATWTMSSSVVEQNQSVGISIQYTSTEATAVKLHGGGAYKIVSLDATNGVCVSNSILVDIEMTKAGQVQVQLIYNPIQAQVHGIVMLYKVENSETYLNVVQNSCSKNVSNCDVLDGSENCSCDLYAKSGLVLSTLLPLAMLMVLMVVAIYLCLRNNQVKRDLYPDTKENSISEKPSLDTIDNGSASFTVSSRIPSSPRHQLSAMLNDPEERIQFFEFLKASDSIENFLFYESAEVFEQCNDRAWRQEEAQSILNKFIREDALYKVALSPKVRSKLCSLVYFDEKSFQDAKAEIYNYMQIEYMPCYLYEREARLEGRQLDVV